MLGRWCKHSQSPGDVLNYVTNWFAWGKNSEAVTSSICHLDAIKLSIDPRYINKATKSTEIQTIEENQNHRLFNYKWETDKLCGTNKLFVSASAWISFCRQGGAVWGKCRVLSATGDG